MIFLLDTNVISELRKAKTGKINPNVKAWAESVLPNDLFLSVITLLELEMGIGLIERRDGTQAALLRGWLSQFVLPAFNGRILAVDTAVALCCGKLHVPDPRSDRDALIAATALVHKMTVVTRNVDDFKPTGVSILNPWEYNPST
ncbi:MAG: type II toxin-antitoxin system VapC family toxin [Methylobacter sp.]|nr:type II toxin-antitoxin system VapC family toxin [Methylobacter sp.]